LATFRDVLAGDLASLLRCPECGGPLAGETGLACGACGARYPVDVERGFAALLPKAAHTAIKDDIRKWWGDLYRQAYAGHEDGLSAAELDRQLAEVEDMFRRRQHLCTSEMPLDELAGKRVLEIGPGSGAHSAIFKRHGASVVAADITPERVMATARKLTLVEAGEGRAYQADGEHLPFRDGSFDIVYSNGVLHHAENTDRCVAEVFRVLKPGGKAVIMLYSRHSAIYWLQVVPRAFFTGEMFRWPEPQWIGRLTEGKPRFGDTKNPITRVYSAAQMRTLFQRFRIHSLRKSSFQFDNFALPRGTQMRDAVLKAMGRHPHPGGILVYGKAFMVESDLELRLGRIGGFCWNMVAEKPV
jgi:ubiquinone/menaquinone biosynthesis C-methylase UbiE